MSARSLKAYGKLDEGSLVVILHEQSSLRMEATREERVPRSPGPQCHHGLQYVMTSRLGDVEGTRAREAPEN